MEHRLDQAVLVLERDELHPRAAPRRAGAWPRRSPRSARAGPRGRGAPASGCSLRVPPPPAGPAGDGRRGGALQFLPRRISLASLREASAGCEGCPLYKDATETVFGRGSSSARAVFVGEQPGNEEDLRGEPFVGPAGRLLDRALERAGIAREDVYLTNVVKHFKWTPKGKLRLHRKPGAREIAACLPWLEKELELIRPHVLVCLGATAAQALLGRDFRVSTQRGRLFPSRFAPRVLATVHPSSILRGDPAERERELERFGADLVTVAGLLDGR